MAITHVGTFSGSTVNETTRAYTTNNLGDLVVLTDATSSGNVNSRAMSVSGGGCAVWTEITAARINSSTGAVTTITMWWGKVTTVGNVTATVTRGTSPGGCQIDVDQWTAGLGANTVWTVQTAAASTGAGGTGSQTMSYPTLTPNPAPTLYVGYVVTGNTGGAGPQNTGANSGFTKTVDSFFKSVRCYNVNVTGTVTPTATQQSNGQYARSAALFTAAPPAAAPTVDAGPDVPVKVRDIEFFRTATEDDGGSTITAREWTIQSAPETPGAILGVGPVAGESHFAVQVADESTGDVEIHSQTEIRDGFEQSPYFVPTGSGTAVQMRASVGGPTTSGSSFARCELREVNPDDTNASWVASVGEHILQGRTVITDLPTIEKGLVFAQLFREAGSADAASFRLQVVSGQLRARIRFGTSSITSPQIAAPYVLGTPIRWRMRIINNRVEYSWALNDDPLPPIDEPTYTHPVDLPADTYYFKAGCYLQSSVDDDAPTDFGSVELSELQGWHTGYPDPFPASVAGTVLGTSDELDWFPLFSGDYTLRYSATNAIGTGHDDVGLTVVDPQRLYLTNSAPDVSPVFSPAGAQGWEDTTAAGHHALAFDKAGANTSATGSESNSSSSWDVLLGQWVSPPLVGSGLVQGDYDVAIADQASSDSVQLRLRAIMRVVSQDGTTERGFMLSAASSLPGVVWKTSPQAEELIGSLQGNIPAPVSYQDGDRIVVELGYRSFASLTTSNSGTMWYGGTSSPDISQFDDPVDTGHPAWMILPSTLVFEQEDVPVEGVLDATLPALSASLAGTVAASGVLAGMLPVPTAALTGSVATSGVLAGTLPLPSADLAADTANPGVLGATLPLVTAALSGTTTSAGVLDGQLPLPTAALVGGTSVPGVLAGTLPLPTADLDATVAAGGVLNASLPLPTAALGGGTANSGTLSGTLPVPVANLSGTLRDTGELDATLPFPTSAITGDVGGAGVLNGTLPFPTAALEGDTANPGVLGANLPIPTGALTGGITGTGTLDASLPLPIAFLGGDGSATGQLAATLPLPAAGLAGETANPGVLDASLPLPTAALTGTVTQTGTLSGTLPLPTAMLSADGSARGQLDATLPVPTAALAGTTANPGQLDATLPLPTAALAGTVTQTGTLDGTLPLPTAQLIADGSNTGTLTAALPMPAASLDGDTSNPGVLGASLPLPAVALDGDVATTGVLEGTLPLPTADLGAAGGNSGSLNATLPMLGAELSGGITVVAVIHGVLPTVTASLTAGVTASGTLSASLPMPTAELAGTTGGQESRLDAVLPMPVAALVGASSTTGVLAGVLPMPTANLTTVPPATYQPPLRAGQPVWGIDRLRAGQPVSDHHL